MFNLKTNIRAVPSGLLAVALLCAGFANAQTSAGPRPRTKTVRVYFVYEGTDSTRAGEIYALKRKVSLTAPLQGALEALVNGPTDDEAKHGYQAATYAEDMKLASVKIKRRIAYAYFTRPPIQGSPPDLASLKFKEAVTRTAKQFPGVRKVVVCVNGQNEFGIGMVEDAPRPCPKEPQ